MNSIAHGKPALRFRFTRDAAASTASHPNVRDDGQRPSLGDETAGFLALIWGFRKQEYFRQQDWTGQITLNRFNKSAFSSSRIAAIATIKS
jgi:hypothetical protein